MRGWMMLALAFLAWPLVVAAAEGKKEEPMIDIHWLGHDAFRIVDALKQVYFDPYQLPDGLPKADVIFITHSHGDHCSPEDVAKIAKADTVIVATADSAVKLPGRKTVIVKPGDSVEAAGLKAKK